MKRPFFWVGIMFALGEAAGLISPDAVAAGIMVSAVFLCVLIYFRARHWDIRKYSGTLVLLFFVCITGALCGLNTGSHADRIYEKIYSDKGDVQITATVEGYALKDNSVELIFDFSGEKISAQIYEPEHLREIVNIKPGQRVLLEGGLMKHDKSSNPGGFDAEGYYRCRGIYLKLEVSDIRIVSDDYDRLKYALLTVRESFADIYDSILPEKEASVVKAMFLGDKSDMDKTLKKLYQSGGIAHILAISGLHVGIIGNGFMGVLKKTGMKLRLACLISVLFIVLYGMMTGFSYATVRAVIMLCVSFAALSIFRTPDVMNSLGLALVVMLVANPDAICDAGFQMSFSAVLGIVIGNHVKDKMKSGLSGDIRKGAKGGIKKLISITDNIIVSLFVNMMMAPLILYYYYELPLYGILVNFMVIPLMGVAAASAFVSGLAGFVSVTLAEISVAPCLLILKIYEHLCRLSLSLPFARINVGSPPEWLIIIYYIMLVGLVCILCSGSCRKKVHLSVVYITICMMLVSASLQKRNDCFRVVFLDVGQGDGAILHFPDGTNIMVDCGTAFGEGTGEYVVAPALKYYGMSHVTYAFVSHTDTDHISGLIYLLDNTDLSGVRIDNLVLSETACLYEGYSELCASAEAAGTGIIYVSGGDVFANDIGSRIEILYPGPCERDDGLTGSDYGVITDKNESSMVFGVECMGYSYIFTGDIGFEAEKYLLDNNLIKEYDVLKVPHHGSRYSSSEAFIQAVSPEIAVISCGKNNVYGHPAKETVETLNTNGVKVYRTDEDGACIFESYD